MRKAFLTISFFCCGYFSQSQTNTAAELSLLKKIDSLTKIINASGNNHPDRDTLLVKVDQLSETFKSHDTGWFEKIWPSIIALATVLISSILAYRIGAKNVKVQEQNALSQIRTQMSIAADNLSMSKEQLDQNTRNTIAQIRANNISKARIEWIQNLRPLLSLLFANITKTSILINEIKKDEEKKSNVNVEKKYQLGREIFFEMTGQLNQIRLFLNTEKESHKNLEKAISEFLQTIVPTEELKAVEKKDTIEKVVESARTVLKEAWEQAKSEVNIA